MAKFTYILRKDRETKGAVLYNEFDANGKQLDSYTGKVANQYFRKHAFEGDIPNEVTVTVEY